MLNYDELINNQNPHWKLSIITYASIMARTRRKNCAYK